MAEIFIWTAQDEVERLLSTQEFRNEGRQRQLARLAILNTLREFPNKARWSYYQRRYPFRTVASQAGTLAYVHTGGAAENLITFTGLTLPTDGTGTLYRVIINNVHYDIYRVLSSTTARLSPENNPGADVAAGTTCTVYRALYFLPVSFRRIGQIFDLESTKPLHPLPDNQIHSANINPLNTPDTPDYFHITGQGEFVSSLMINLVPPPRSARSYDVLYEAGPQQINTWKFSTGTVTTDGTTTVVTSSNMLSRFLGAILRIGFDATIEPTGLHGNLAGEDNPFLAQRSIIGVPTITTLLIDDILPALSAYKFTISDPIDIENGAMLLAFQKSTDAEFASLLNKDDWQTKLVAAERATRLAIENDQREPYSRGLIPFFDRFSHTVVTTDPG